jgi:hypothetical protein
MASRNDSEKRELNQKYDRDVKTLTEEVNVKRNLEVETREQKQKIDTLIYELDLAKNELREVREANKGLDLTKFS